MKNSARQQNNSTIFLKRVFSATMKPIHLDGRRSMVGWPDEQTYYITT